MKNRYFIVFVFSCMTWPAFAALTTTTGKEWELWTRGKYVVAVATVDDVIEQPRDRDGPTHELRLRPIATLAGQFDATSVSRLSVYLWVSHGTGTLVRKAPARGAIIIAVMQLGIDRGEPPTPQNWIVPDICTFMPDHLSVVVIDGLADPKVMQVIDRIRAARANPDPSPYPSTTTRPASGATEKESRL